MEVLEMQSKGERVVSLLIEPSQLVSKHKSKLTYMDGGHIHERDPFEFLVHDLKHMETFVNEKTYREQVGFFKSIMELDDNSPFKFFERHCPKTNIWEKIE